MEILYTKLFRFSEFCKGEMKLYPIFFGYSNDSLSRWQKEYQSDFKYFI